MEEEDGASGVVKMWAGGTDAGLAPDGTITANADGTITIKMTIPDNAPVSRNPVEDAWWGNGQLEVVAAVRYDSNGAANEGGEYTVVMTNQPELTVQAEADVSWIGHVNLGDGTSTGMMGARGNIHLNFDTSQTELPAGSTITAREVRIVRPATAEDELIRIASTTGSWPMKAGTGGTDVAEQRVEVPLPLTKSGVFDLSDTWSYDTVSSNGFATHVAESKAVQTQVAVTYPQSTEGAGNKGVLKA